MNDKDISKKKFKSLVKLSNDSNINLFKKNKKDWVLRDKRIIVDECKKMKKKMVKKLSTNLKNLTLEENIKLEKIKQYQNSTISELDNLDTIINILTYSENDNENYIEVYEN